MATTQPPPIPLNQAKGSRATHLRLPAAKHGVYVFPDETFGGAEGEEVCLQSSTGGNHLLRTAGSLEQWRDHVGRYCAGNSRLLFAASLGFAPPLLGVVDDEGGGFHFRGASSQGKTTCQHVAGSLWGGGSDKGYLKRWRATANGLESVAEFHNDGLLCLDELAECDPKAADEVAYMLANGQGKLRMARSMTLRRTFEWRLFFLSSGETSLADHIAQAGKRARGGQEVRLINIEADAGRGLGIFEKLHEFADGSAFAKHLVAASKTYYGTPIRAFIKAVVGEQDSIRQAARNFMRAFQPKHAPEQAGGEVLRVASRFALVAFGGELATGYEITGWPNGEATSVAAIFRQWHDARGTAGVSDEEAAVRQVRAFIEAHGSSRFESDSNLRAINRAGFRLIDEEGNTEYCILPEAFRREVCAGFDYRMVARVLQAGCYLHKGEGKNLPAKRTPPSGGKQIRVYVIKDSIFESDRSDGRAEEDIHQEFKGRSGTSDQETGSRIVG